MEKLNYSEYKNQLSLRNKIGRLVWSCVYRLFFKPFPTFIFRRWQIYILRVFGARIGKNCTVYNSVKIWAPWKLIMEDNSIIGENCNCYNPAVIHLKSQTVISNNVSFVTASHRIESKKHELIFMPIVIQSYSWVASEAYIGMGVTVGEGSVVAARAVVVKDVEPWTVVGGNPAKFIKKRLIII